MLDLRDRTYQCHLRLQNRGMITKNSTPLREQKCSRLGASRQEPKITLSLGQKVNEQARSCLPPVPNLTLPIVPLPSLLSFLILKMEPSSVLRSPGVQSRLHSPVTWRSRDGSFPCLLRLCRLGGGVDSLEEKSQVGEEKNWEGQVDTTVQEL